MSSAADNQRGILAMLTAMALFALNDTLLKIATSDLPASQIMAIRGLFASVLAIALVFGTGAAGHFKALWSPVVAVRAALEATLSFTFVTSLAHLQLANITAILQTTPILITLLTVLLGLERVGWRRWIAIGGGFAGALLIVKPSLSGFNVYAGLAFLCAALVAVRDLVTRSINGRVPSVVVMTASTLAVTFCGFGLSFGETWRALNLSDLALLATAAALVTAGNVAIIKAFRIGDVSVVSPFRYSVILAALLAGYVVFGDFPDAVSLAGIALIVSSGLYTFHREQIRLKEMRQTIDAASTAGESP